MVSEAAHAPIGQNVNKIQSKFNSDLTQHPNGQQIRISIIFCIYLDFCGLNVSNLDDVINSKYAKNSVCVTLYIVKAPGMIRRLEIQKKHRSHRG